MGNVVEHSAETANALLALVDLAAGDLAGVYPPSGLNLVTTFLTGTAAGGAQGMLLTGTIAGIDTPVCVLAVAARWPLFQSFFVQEKLTETRNTPASIGLGGMVATGYAIMFDSLRPLVWNGLATVAKVPGFTTTYPLLVVGMGPGGPLAQLLTLELRPGRPGPGSSPGGAAPATSPASAVGGYSFSTPPFGDGIFATSAARVLSPATVALFRCNAEGIDFYPSGTGAPGGFAYCGDAKPCQGRIPPIDTPWLERTPAYYRTIYGQPLPALPDDGTLDVMPPGFSRDLAHTLSCLCANVYTRRQHPELGPSFPVGCRWVADVLVDGVVWASLFTGPIGAAVAIRGPVSWMEGLGFYGTGNLTELRELGGSVLAGLAAFHDKFHAALLKTLADNATALTGKGAGNAINVAGTLHGFVQNTPQDDVPPLAIMVSGTVTGTAADSGGGTVAGTVAGILSSSPTPTDPTTVTGTISCPFFGRVAGDGSITGAANGTFTATAIRMGTVLGTVSGYVGGTVTDAVHLAGHDYGGALAVLSALRLKAAQPERGPAPNMVYGFGTVRFCDDAFASRTYAAIAGSSHQVIRRNDVIAGNAGPLAMAPLPSLIHLSGGLLSPLNSTTGHALALYVSLLAPQLGPQISTATAGTDRLPERPAVAEPPHDGE